jgi:GntR family transcriptional regulator
MTLRLDIAPGSGTPIYRQIVEAVRRAVLAGELKPGAALPSVRALAEQVVVNPNTVARAYTELAGEGWIQAQPGRGMFVAERIPTVPRAQRQRQLQHAAAAMIEQALALGIEPHDLPDEVRDALCNALDRALRRLGQPHPIRSDGGETAEETNA